MGNVKVERIWSRSPNCSDSTDASNLNGGLQEEDSTLIPLSRSRGSQEFYRFGRFHIQRNNNNLYNGDIRSPA